MASVAHSIGMAVPKAVPKVAAAKVVLSHLAVKAVPIMAAHIRIATSAVKDLHAKIIAVNAVRRVAVLKVAPKVALRGAPKAVMVSATTSKVAAASHHSKNHHLAVLAPMVSAKKSKINQMIGAIKITTGNNKPSVISMPTTCHMSNL